MRRRVSWPPPALGDRETHDTDRGDCSCQPAQLTNLTEMDISICSLLSQGGSVLILEKTFKWHPATGILVWLLKWHTYIADDCRRSDC